jgi:hypothetical protein
MRELNNQENIDQKKERGERYLALRDEDRCFER